MAGYVGILVSDPWLQNQFTQVELRSLKSQVIVLLLLLLLLLQWFPDHRWKSAFQLQYVAMRRESGPLTLADLPSKMSKLKVVGENLTEEERDSFLRSSYQNMNDEVDFELFLRVSLLDFLVSCVFPPSLIIVLQLNWWLSSMNSSVPIEEIKKNYSRQNDQHLG